MEKKNIQGRVLYKFLRPASLEVNLSCGKGFKLTAATPEKFHVIARLSKLLRKNSLVTLDLDGGQIVSVTNRGRSVNLRENFPEIGAMVLETTYKKVPAVFKKKELIIAPCGSALALTVSGAEKDVYCITAGIEQNDHLSVFMDAFSPGDSLSMQQGPDGQLIGIVNHTRVCEYAWSNSPI